MQGKKGTTVFVDCKCLTCGKEFKIPFWMVKHKQHTGKYCSRECNTAPHLRSMNTTEHSLKASDYRWGAYRKLRHGTIIPRPDGYSEIVLEVNGRLEYMLLHRYVAEIHILGRKLKPGEVVHHKDHDRTNNTPSNLQVLASQAEHARLHFKKGGDA